MQHRPSYSFFPLGDAAILMNCGDVMNAGINAFIIQCFHLLKSKQPAFITDLVPAYSSLTIHYKAAEVRTWKKEEETSFDAVAKHVKLLLEQPLKKPVEGRLLRIPVCYQDDFAPDLKALAATKSLTADDVVRIHTSRNYRVYMLGFLPGFAYMGEVDAAIAMSRHTQPRKEVAAGSVGIAGEQTGIYPLTSPGGWQIIGRTPMALFDVNKDNPVALQPGDVVQFYSITAHEFTDYQGRTA
jgi:inhibitor of KinA